MKKGGQDIMTEDRKALIKAILKLLKTARLGKLRCVYTLLLLME